MEEKERIRGGYTEDELYNLAMDGDWAAPEPLPGEDAEVNPFPVFALPPSLGLYVEALSESTQTPPEMAGALVLGVLASTFQGRYVIEPTPGWIEPLCLYIAAVAGPGERKSSVMKAVTAPLYAYETRRQMAERVELSISQARRDVAQKRIEKLKAQLAAKPSEAAAKELAEQIELLNNLPESHQYRLLIDDTTPEKLADIMSEQGGCISVCSPEGGVFTAMGGRYDGGANYDVYLKGHAGDPIKVDRIGRSSNIIINPRLTMLLAVQPEVISGIMKDRQMRGRGVCARFLYSWCPSLLGKRSACPRIMDDDIRNDYTDRVLQALDGSESGILRGDAEFNQLRINYQQAVEAELGGASLEAIRDWGGKLVGAVLRIAALFHCWYHPLDAAAHPIPASTLQQAMSIGDFFASSARRAYNVLEYSGKYNLAHYVLDKLRGCEDLTITRSELLHLCRRRCAVSEMLKEPLSLLEEAGYLRLERKRDVPHRPALTVQLNPLAKLM